MKYATLYGVAFEFDDPGTLVDAARLMHEQGVRKMEAYTPYSVPQVDDYIEEKRPLPLLVLIGGAAGTLTAWAMQYYIAMFDYPTNIGGRPLNSWPAFIVIMFELTILFASLTAFIGALAMCGLPLPHHPMFSVPGFAAASTDRFFLCVECADPRFDREAIVNLLSDLDPLEVHDVEAE